MKQRNQLNQITNPFAREFRRFSIDWSLESGAVGMRSLVSKRLTTAIGRRSNWLDQRSFSSTPSNAERFYLDVTVEPCESPDPSKHYSAIRSPPSQLRSKDEIRTPSRPSAAWYTVTLDGRPLKTPAGRQLQIPSEPLAYGIASEWNAVERLVQPSSMPLMVTACTALDHSTIQIDECMRFFQTDTLCYWADPTADRVLYREQQAAWETLHTWIQDEFLACAGDQQQQQQHVLAQVFGTAESMVFLKQQQQQQGTTTSPRTGVGLPHTAELVQDCREWLTSLDAWHATIAQLTMRETKSFFLGAALVTRACSAKAAQKASRVEEEFQISSWGLVEGQHDYDRLNSSIQLHAASFATQCLHLSLET